MVKKVIKLVNKSETMSIVLTRDNWLNLSADRKNDDGIQRKKIELTLTPRSIIKVLRGTGEYSGWEIDRRTKSKLVNKLNELD